MSHSTLRQHSLLRCPTPDIPEMSEQSSNMLNSATNHVRIILLIAVEILWLIGKVKMPGTISILEYRLQLQFLNLLKLNGVKSAAKYDNEAQLHFLACILKSG